MDELAAKIIKDTIYAVVATSSRSELPWNSPVYVAYDDELNFYWASGKESRHSNNIRKNPHVSLVIFDSSAPWRTGEGVYIESDASEVTDLDEIEKACRVRAARVPDAAQKPEEFIGDAPRRIYKAVSRKFWVNYDSKVDGYFVAKRVEVNINALRERLGHKLLRDSRADGEVS